MGTGRAAEEFRDELSRLYETAKRPPLKTLAGNVYARLGKEQPSLEAEQRKLSVSSLSEWLRGESVPRDDKTRVFLALAAELQDRVVAGSGYQPRAPGQWQQLLGKAQREREAAQKAGRPKRRTSPPAYGKGPARRDPIRDQIMVYLQVLVRWLNSDPWPQDRRLETEGPPLTPESIERRLRVTTGGDDKQEYDKQEYDADELAARCQRLVILGGPGTGKTWLAMHLARQCAKSALAALARGESLDEIELPLYTTCWRLFKADGGLSSALVSSALDHLGVLPPGVDAPVRRFLTERDAPTLVVIDSLDEAQGLDEAQRPDNRLRQAGALPWRVILTSRPSSWNNQLTIEMGNDAHRVGELQPLRYPDDCEPFIRKWFEQHPERGDSIVAQIARQPGLQQAATVPLVLAFYCIIGCDKPLPEFRHDLYARVVRQMLIGPWRGRRGRMPRQGKCLEVLRERAWAGATADLVTGLGTWEDEIPAGLVPEDEADREAVDHIAPLFDPGETRRRFIHRSIREHLVAEHVASLPVEQAAEILLPHLWYDTDWEYAAPAAIAMHRERDLLLRDVVRRASGTDHIPADLSVIEADWQFHEFLGQVAAESSSEGWSPELAALIGEARVALARATRFGSLPAAAQWTASNARVIETLTTLLTHETTIYPEWAGRAADALARLCVTAEDRSTARSALTGALISDTEGKNAAWLAGPLSRLGPAPEDTQAARDALVRRVARRSDDRPVKAVDALIQVSVTPEDVRAARAVLLRLLAAPDKRDVPLLTGALIRLDPTPEDRHAACYALTMRLAEKTYGGDAAELADALMRLDPARRDRHAVCIALIQLLNSKISSPAKMTGALIAFFATAEEKRVARKALISCMAYASGEDVLELAGTLIQLDPKTGDKQAACERLSARLANETSASTAADIANALSQLEPAREDKHAAGDMLARLLAIPESIHNRAAGKLTGALIRLSVTADDKQAARSALISYLAGQRDGVFATEAVQALVQLGPAAADKQAAREILIGSIGPEAFPIAPWLLAPWPVARDYVPQLATLLMQLDPAPEDRQQACEALTSLLAAQGSSKARSLESLTSAIIRLDPTTERRRAVCGVLISLLAAADADDDSFGPELADALTRVSVGEADRGAARDALTGILARQDNRSARFTAGLAEALVSLDPAAKDERTARGALTRLLRSESGSTTTSESDCWTAIMLTRALTKLNPTAQDKDAARGALTRLMAWQDSSWVTERLIEALIELSATSDDRAAARDALVRLLSRKNCRNDWFSPKLADAVVKLAVTAQDKSAAREALIGLMAGKTCSWCAAGFAWRLSRLDPTAEDNRAAGNALSQLLACEADCYHAPHMAEALTQLDPSQEEKTEARRALIRLLAAAEGYQRTAYDLMRALGKLDPTARDLIGWRAWPSAPSAELLAASRLNSSQDEWLDALPSLPARLAPGTNDPEWEPRVPEWDALS